MKDWPAGGQYPHLCLARGRGAFSLDRRFGPALRFMTTVRRSYMRNTREFRMRGRALSRAGLRARLMWRTAR
jgi:hypothetical protein